MKKFLLLLMISLLIPFYGWAEDYPVFNNARITEITSGDSKLTIDYDSQGRIVSEYGVNSYRGEFTLFNYTYSGSTIIVNISGESYGETFDYQMEIPITNGHIERSYEYGNELTYIYDGENKLIQLYSNAEEPLNADYTWTGNLLTAYHNIEYYDSGKNPERNANFTYTNETADIQALAFFNPTNFVTGWPDLINKSFLGLFLQGKVPDRLVSQAEVTDIEWGKAFPIDFINFRYTRDNRNFITRAEVSKYNGESHNEWSEVYEFTWEGTSEVPDKPDPDNPKNEEIVEEGNGGTDYSKGDIINEGSELNGNVIGNIYYNIGSGDGGYDPVEGCITISKPTDDEAIEGKDIFGEDFKNHYCGLVFKVKAGKGKISINAETTGMMMIKVRIGKDDPIEMQTTKGATINIPYNVSEPTFVYIYGTAFTGARGVSKGQGSELKIYSFDWGVTDGIDDVSSESSVNGDYGYYTLDGRRIQSVPSQKGMYIHQGKKYLVK